MNGQIAETQSIHVYIHTHTHAHTHAQRHIYKSNCHPLLWSISFVVINEVNCTLQVEIKCRGQPVLGNLPLEKVQNIWLATTTSFELLPALKQLNIAARENRNWPQFMSRPADDCVMVLTYSRKF